LDHVLIRGSRRLPCNNDEVANFAERKRLLLTTASNGVWLAETADDFIDGISKNLPNYPTGNSPMHLGPHSEYDKLINEQITNVLKANNIDNPNSFNFSILSKESIEAMIDDIEDLSIDILENWKPAHLK